MCVSRFSCKGLRVGGAAAGVLRADGGEGAAGGGPVGGAGEGEAEGHAHVDARAEVRDGDGRVEIDSGCGCEETLVKHSPGWRSQGKII